jgi:DNA end-binding protein Ku
MAPRPHWKGYLKLSLVSCPIALYPAISPAERISFRQVNRQTGNRLRQQLVDTVTGEVVAAHDKARGYEVGERQHLLVEDEDLEKARSDAKARPWSTAPVASAATAAPVELPVPDPAPRAVPRRAEQATTLSPKSARETPADFEPVPSPPVTAPPPVVNDRTIALDRFVPMTSVDPIYFDAPYYIVPRDEIGQEAYAVIRDAMGETNMAGMGRVVLQKRERPIIIQPFGEGIRGFTLRYAHEIRDSKAYFDEIEKLDLPEEMIEVAKRIIEMKAGEFDPAFLEDRYRTSLVGMLREKQATFPVELRAPEPSRQNVIDLMAALKRSLSTEKSAAPTKAKAARRAAAAAKVSPTKRARPRSR